MVQATEKTTGTQSATFEKVFTVKPTARVERLREAFFAIKPRLSIDRARIEARVMKETEGESMITRRSKVFAAVLREMPVDIYPHELVVGLTGPGPLCANVVPGAFQWTRQKMANVAQHAESALPVGLSDDDMRELEEELIPCWKQQGRSGIIAYSHYGHNIHDMKKVVKKGFLGIAESPRISD